MNTPEPNMEPPEIEEVCGGCGVSELSVYRIVPCPYFERHGEFENVHNGICDDCMPTHCNEYQECDDCGENINA